MRFGRPARQVVDNRPAAAMFDRSIVWNSCAHCHDDILVTAELTELGTIQFVDAGDAGMFHVECAAVHFGHPCAGDGDALYTQRGAALTSSNRSGHKR